ncbi:autotransporter outer membrane beta-barrel domain-containing protein [uncultured Dialister sp.]|uniref:autotransporter outer membrane beta-barrel domain-containing protein n=2 Tax=Dialister TaxID=39948 RepID=UPI0026DB5751|nr:autotransporter outer membrane beta-barrel domain-containing protein [uncultured Dialister sp.]
MNHIYKVVWSRARNCYMAVSEIAKGHSKSSGKAKAAKGGKMILASLAVAAMAFGTTAYADYDPTTNTDTLTNQRISTTMADTSKGDLKTYDHTDRNLVINWNKDNNRDDGSAIRNSTVKAKNLTVRADFEGNQWDNKGVISDIGSDTHMSVSDTIDIKAYDDAVYTSGDNSKVTIDGFKKLNIKSTGEGYGLVDNGGGITIRGGADSTVNITTDAGPEHAAIGDSLRSYLADDDPNEKYGTGITIDAGQITLDSKYQSIFAGVGKKDTFAVNLNAPVVTLKGEIIALRGATVSIDPDMEGTVKISSGEAEDASYDSISASGEESKVIINEHKGGLVQVLGEVDAQNGASVYMNMTKAGSYINTKGDGEHDNYYLRHAITVGQDSDIKLDISGNDSFIRGDMYASGGQLDINVSGRDFSLSRSSTQKDFLLKTDYKGTANLKLSGDQAKITGNFTATGKSKINLQMSGDHAVFAGNMKTQLDENSSIEYGPDDYSVINAQFSGKNARMTGDLQTIADHSTITADFSGDNGSLTGDVKATGLAPREHIDLSTRKTWWERASGTTLNLNMTGAHTSQIGNLVADGNNTLNASYTGKESSLTGKADNTGIMSLAFDNKSQMSGNMTNGHADYEDGTSFDGKLKADFNNGSRWNGDLNSTSGTANISLNNGSVWDGSSTGNGDINLAGNSVWNLTKDSTANSVNPDGSSVVSLAGDAKKLEVRKLGGSGGTFLMDLNYKDNNVDTYRDGGDYIIAHGGSGSAYNVSLTSGSSVNGMTDGSKLYFASTAADSSTFRMNQAVQVENYKKIYNKNLIVKKETDASGTDLTGYDDWFLTPDTSKGNGGNTINPNGIVPGSVANAAFALWRDDDTLLKRLGELRYDQQDDGIWARMDNKHLERDGSHGFKGNYKTIQVGYDKKKDTENNGSWYYGGAISHLWGDTNYTDGHGSQKETDLSIYGTNIRPHGHYLDLIARVGRIDSDYTTSYGDHGKFENWGMSLGAEYGRQKALGGGWSIEPQAQLTYHYLWGDDYTTRNGAKVSQDNTDSLVGRLGFVLSREFNGGTDHAGRVYLKASILHDFLGDTASTITDDISYHDDDDLGDTWYVAGLGTDINLGKNTRFYFDAERNFNADVKMKYRFNAGLRFGF